MRVLIYLFLAVVITPLQMTLFDHTAVFGIKPDVALLATYAVALVYGEVDGVGLGILLGWLQDVYAGTALGVHLVPLGIAGLLSGLMGRAIVNVTFIFSIGGLFFISMAQLLLRRVLFDGFSGFADFLGAMWHLIIPVGIANCVVGAIAYMAWDHWESSSKSASGSRAR